MADLGDTISAKIALDFFYNSADISTAQDPQQAAAFLVTNADDLFQKMNEACRNDGMLTPDELAAFHAANQDCMQFNFMAENFGKMFGQVLQECRQRSMMSGPINQFQFRQIVEHVLGYHAPQWGVQIPPAGVWHISFNM